MSGPHPHPGGGANGEIKPNPNTSKSSSPDQLSPTYAKAVGGGAGGQSHLMKYAEIIAQQKSQRNVLEVKLRKIIHINKDTNEKMDPPKNLTIDDLSEIIFETMNIQFKDCLGVDYYTGRYDTREIMLKPGVDSSRYITIEPMLFKDHEIIVKKKAE